jgi:putative ABC transport system permease protein
MIRRTPMWRRYSTLFGRNIRSDVEEELKFHIETRMRELVDAGWSPQAAEEEAHRLFGDRDSILAECQQIDTRFEQRRRVSAYLADIAADIRFALRTLRKTPAVTAISIVTLALGLGATTAIFSVVNTVRLKPLPYAGSERLVKIVENVPAGEGMMGMPMRLAAVYLSELDGWRKAETLSDVAIVTGPTGRTLVTNEGGVQLYGMRVSPALFAMRGVQPLLGRGLLPEEERADADVVVLGERAWREHFGADPDIVGRTIVLEATGGPTIGAEARVLTVVGVMPAEFGADSYWTPFFAPRPGPGRTMLSATARLRDGVSLEAAAAEVNALGLAMRGITPEPGTPPRFEVVSELDEATASVVPPLRVLVAAVAAVLLIVCTNVANLLLVRGTQRQQEIAIRRSLGATRGRIVRLVLVESLTLAAAAGVLGTALAFGAVELLKITAIVDLPRRFQFGATILPRAEEIAIDPTVLMFVVGLILVTGTLFGVLPAVRLSRFGEKGHHAAAQLSASASNTRVGHVLATVQLAFAMTLLIGAGLLLNSFFRLAAVDAGFDARGVLGFDVVVPGTATAERRLEVAQALTARLRAQPRVTAAGFSDRPPLIPGFWITATFVPEGRTAAEAREAENALPPMQRAQTRNASSGYLRALGARLVEGAWLEDTPSAVDFTVLVSRPYAQRYFPGRSAVGATLSSGAGTATIVGVVDDIHLGTLQGAPESVVFMEPSQSLAAQRAHWRGIDQVFLTIGGGISFAARTDGDPLAIAADLRGIVRDIDPNLAVDSVIPMEAVLSGVTTRPRFYALLLSAFGAIAGFVAVIGIYGVLAYLVSQRTREIGIRMALGAQRASVLRLVLRRGVTMVAIGVTAGVLGAVGLTRYLAGMLYGIGELDAATYVAVAAAFAIVALFACYMPARRATRIDPHTALRED